MSVPAGSVLMLVGDDGVFREVHLGEGDTLGPLQRLLDGYVDCVAADGIDVWVSDDGLMRSDFAPNTAVSALLESHGSPDRRIVGPAVIARCDQRTGETVGLDPATLAVLHDELDGLGCSRLAACDPETAAEQQHGSRQQRLSLDYQGHGWQPQTSVAAITDREFAQWAADAAASARSEDRRSSLGGLCGAMTGNGRPCRHPAPPPSGRCAAGHQH